MDANEKYMEATTLAERQMFYYNGSKCPYCKQETELVSSDVIHQEEHGMIYHCKSCEAAVGTIYGDKALGSLAKKSLRDLRRTCHNLLDKMIEKKVSFGKITQRTARIRMYKWLATFLGIDRIECHVGYWDNEKCNKVIEECRNYLYK